MRQIVGYREAEEVLLACIQVDGMCCIDDTLVYDAESEVCQICKND